MAKRPNQSSLNDVAVTSGSVSGASGISGKTKGGRESFNAFELTTVMSNFDVGVIQVIQEFPRGSRKAPKLILRSDKGMYLLKRRARGKDEPFKVAFCHQLQIYLANKQFPLPHLIGTKQDNNSMLQLDGAIYELFEYIKGTSYDNSLEATADSGKILSLFHKLLSDYEPEYEPPQGSYHAARSVARSLEKIPTTLRGGEQQGQGPGGGPGPGGGGDRESVVSKIVQFMSAAYNEAALRVTDLGLTDWPMQIVHSDWHPGNMLFRGPRVVAVIDYDAARIQQRVIDVANGSLQFSILGGGDDPMSWPDYIDLARYKRFLRGYESVPGQVLSKAEIQCIPWLMTEALIAEAVIPIAATGLFARHEGLNFLQMVQRKVTWLREHAKELAEVV